MFKAIRKRNNTIGPTGFIIFDRYVLILKVEFVVLKKGTKLFKRDKGRCPQKNSLSLAYIILYFYIYKHSIHIHTHIHSFK